MNNDKVIFFKDDHSYWYNQRRLKSVGSVIKTVTPPFKEGYWLTHSVLKEAFGDEYKEHYRSFKQFAPPANKLFGPFISRMNASQFMNLKQKYRDQWDFKRSNSALLGTRFHDVKESGHYESGEMINPWTGYKFPTIVFEKEYDNESLALNLFDLEDGGYSELLVFDLELGIAGQADQVFIETVRGKRYIDINDYKTNEKKPSKSSPEYCLPPFENQYASTHFKYTLQIGSYAYLLERHGFIPRTIGYTHYKNYNPLETTQEILVYEKAGISKVMLNLC